MWFTQIGTDDNHHSTNAMVQVNGNYTYFSKVDVHLFKKCLRNSLEFMAIS